MFKDQLGIVKWLMSSPGIEILAILLAEPLSFATIMIDSIRPGPLILENYFLSKHPSSSLGSLAQKTGHFFSNSSLAPSSSLCFI